MRKLFNSLHLRGLRNPKCSALTLGLILLSACGGGGGSGSGGGSTGGFATCNFSISAQPQALTAAEVEQLLARAVSASSQLGANATIAVSDRVGNVLGVYKMNGAAATVTISSGRNNSGAAVGLDGLTGIIPSELAAIAKATTGAYLSSSGNAFSTRTASFIVQEHFAPGILTTAAGPLFGVQFSQLPCGDFVTRGDAVGVGPKRSPLGLSADPGGFPLYKNGRVVGGIGVIADGVYGLDLDPTDNDNSIDERIAQSALSGFDAPDCIRADRVTLGGLTPAYSDSDRLLVSASITSLAHPSIVASGSLVSVSGYIGAPVARAGSAYGEPASGFIPAQDGLQSRGAYVLVNNASVNRHPAAASTAPAVGAGGMTAGEVTEILSQALGVANQSRAQIRRPVSSPAQVTVSIVDRGGNILGVARTEDAPVFGTDVSLQKARTAAFFSSASAAAALLAQPDFAYAQGGTQSIAAYMNAPTTGAQAFFSRGNIFADGTAFSARAIGNIARPLYPDGIDNTLHGPFSKPISNWSPFNVGLQLDLVYPSFVGAVLTPASANMNCTGAGGITGLNNGMQIFPGSVPIYRNGNLIGAIGVSGDGVDQDDMISFLGLARAGSALNTGIGNAPAGLRADQLAPRGFGLRYAQCPQAPFLNSNEQNVCSGL